MLRTGRANLFLPILGGPCFRTDVGIARERRSVQCCPMSDFPRNTI